MAILNATASIRPAAFARWTLACLASWMFALSSVAQPPAPSEYEIKAVFLFNFARFVVWPPTAFPDSAAPFVIGVLGDNPFGDALDQAAKAENVNGHPLEVRHFRAVSEIGACQILFISRSESGRMDEILRALKGRSLLTVSDATDFANRGGIIRFVSENNRIRLRINLEAAAAAGLTISSKLLRPAEIVGNRGE